MTRKNKFGVAPKSRRTLDGIVFASKGESRRWAELQLLEKAGQIKGLCRQISFPLCAIRSDGVMVEIARYVADFVYTENGVQIVEDYKGVMTPLARHKIAHFEAEYGAKIKLTGHSKPMRRAKVRA